MEEGKYRKLPHREKDNCFGCSPNNFAGLHLEFFTNGEKIVSWLRVPKHLSGWDQIVHGGVIATMLDEVMGWSALHLLRKMPLTKTITVEYLKPVYVDEDLTIEGRPVGNCGDREAVIQAFLYNKDGELCSKATGRFALFTFEAMRERGVVDEKVLEDVQRVIAA